MYVYMYIYIYIYIYIYMYVCINMYIYIHICRVCFDKTSSLILVGGRSTRMRDTIPASRSASSVCGGVCV